MPSHPPGTPGEKELGGGGTGSVTMCKRDIVAKAGRGQETSPDRTRCAWNLLSDTA